MNSSVKWSNFLITVNLNDAAGAGNMSGIIDAVHGMAESDWIWRWLKQYSGGARVDFSERDKSLVESVRMRVALEEGGTNNQSLHAHILLEVAHRTMVQVDYTGIKDVFAYYTDANPNVNVKYIKGSGAERDYILKYITKEVPPRNGNGRALSTISRVFESNSNVYDVKNNYPT